VHVGSIAGNVLGSRAGKADKTPASGQASPPPTHPEETACRLIRSAGSGNCDQARLAVIRYAMAPSRRVVPARGRAQDAGEAFGARAVGVTVLGTRA
jgi:hypothetical protein